MDDGIRDGPGNAETGQLENDTKRHVRERELTRRQLPSCTMDAVQVPMEKWFQVGGLDTERLLSEWRWLCPSRMLLIARNVFGELFLRDEVGAVFWLNTTIGKFNKASGTEAEFREMAETSEKRKEWFAEPEALSYGKRGLNPGLSQCIGFSVPAVFAEGGTPETAYVADLLEYVSFLGDLHRQITDLPDGGKVQLRVNPPKPALPKRP